MGKKRIKRFNDLNLELNLSDKKNYIEVEVGNLCDYIKLCMKLRAPEKDKQEGWSFRGQRDHSWKLGIKYKFENVKEKEIDNCFKQFRKRCKEFPKPDYINEDDSWAWLFFAQHYGLHNRLLDWTTNPLVALYFGVENIISSGKDYNLEKHTYNKKCEKKNDRRDLQGIIGCVWALKVKKIHFVSSNSLVGKKSPEKLKKWVMIDPPPITSRIARQSGKFTYHPKRDCYNISELARRSPDEELIKIVLRRNSDKSPNPSAEIRAQLGIMNIHHAYLFPDPDGVAKFINYEWKMLLPK